MNDRPHPPLSTVTPVDSRQAGGGQSKTPSVGGIVPITTRRSGLPITTTKDTIIPSSTTESPGSATIQPTPTPSLSSTHTTQYHTTQIPNPGQIQTTSTNTNHHAEKESLGPIVGGVVGGVVALLVIAIVGYLIWRRRKTRQESEYKLDEEDGALNPEVVTTSYGANVPTIVSPSTPSQFASELAASSSTNDKGGVKVRTTPSASSMSKTAEGKIRLSYRGTNNRLTSSSLMEPAPPPYITS